MAEAERTFRVHPLWRQMWERDQSSPYQRLSEPDLAWHFARELYRKDPDGVVDDDALDIGFGPGASRVAKVQINDPHNRVAELGQRLAEQDRNLGRTRDSAIVWRESIREPVLIPAPPTALRPMEIKPADLSIRERIGNAAMDVGAHLGAVSSTQRYLNRQTTALADFTPGLNVAVGLNDAGRKIRAGNVTDGSAELGLLTVGMLPGVGMVAKKGAKEIRLGLQRSRQNAASGRFGISP